MLRLICFAALIAFPATSWAEVHNCDGRWTNKPCAGKVEEVLPEYKQPEGSAGDPALSQKRTIFHDLTMKAIEAKHRYDLRFDLGGVREGCFKETASLSDCRKLVNVMAERIDRSVAEKAALLAKEKANELQEEQNKLQQEGSNNVTVVQEIRLRRHHRRHGPKPPAPGDEAPAGSAGVNGSAPGDLPKKTAANGSKKAAAGAAGEAAGTAGTPASGASH